MKVAYIAGAFRSSTQWGIVQNVRQAEELSLELWRKGYAVICPHTMTQNFQGECPDKVFLDGCLELLQRCDLMIVVDGWTDSVGTQSEIDWATELGIPVYYSLDKVK